MVYKQIFHPFNSRLANLVGNMQRYWHTAMETNGSPRSLAQAFALGTFISLLPTPGLNFVLATLLATLFKQLNRGALFAALGVWNAFVATPFYALSYQVSRMLFDSTTVSNKVGVYFLLGNLIVALSMTAVSYLLIHLLVQLRHQHK
jgi:uncharacterized protein (DUF2062 family)